MLARAALIALLAAAAVFAADVTGKWQFQVETTAGSGSPTFTLTQSGEKLTGKYSGALGDADIGTVTGSTVTIQFDAPGRNVVYKGELQGADNIKGKVDPGGQAQGTFTGTRAK